MTKNGSGRSRNIDEAKEQSMSKQKKQFAGDKSRINLVEDIEDEEKPRNKPIVIIGFILYVIFASVALITFIYYTRMFQNLDQ